jgi:hypothetical protein
MPCVFYLGLIFLVPPVIAREHAVMGFAGSPSDLKRQPINISMNTPATPRIDSIFRSKHILRPLIDRQMQIAPWPGDILHEARQPPTRQERRRTLGLKLSWRSSAEAGRIPLNSVG